MLERIIAWSVENRKIMLVLTGVIAVAGAWAVTQTPVDAVPDLSDVQVIVLTEMRGQAPQIVEDQVTYPISTAMLAVPKARTVRGISQFGLSFVYVIFEDDTDLYWARSRVLEALNTIGGDLPGSVQPQLGPDATGVGWVFQYYLEGDDYDLAQLRSIQDWYLRYELESVPGVSEVATLGGFEKQYQVLLDPDRLRGYGIPLSGVRRVGILGRARRPRARAGRYGVHGARLRVRGRPRWPRSWWGPTAAARPSASGTSATCGSAPRSGAGSRTSTDARRSCRGSSSCASARTPWP